MRISKFIFITVICFILVGCDKPVYSMTEFEKFAYEGCVKESKYSNSICSCNAANLDKTLSEDEKQNYKKAALGDLASASKLLPIIDKLKAAILICAK